MGSRIHSTAVIDPQATIGCDVSIGPFCIIEAGAVIGDGCRLAAHVVVKKGTTLGVCNEVDEYVVLGGRPQHIARHTCWGQVRIGARNMIREHVTVHGAMSADSVTVIGDENLLMVNAHVAHDCQVGNHTIITNNVMLAGHVTVGDYAYLSGGVGVHQFCRIGSHCMVGGQAHINKDVPPYVTVDGVSTRVVGLNLIGLRRRGFTAEQILELKQATGRLIRTRADKGVVIVADPRVVTMTYGATFRKSLPCPLLRVESRADLLARVEALFA